jgi:hypothetical protein
MTSRTELSAVWPPNVEAALDAGHDNRTLPLQAIRAKWPRLLVLPAERGSPVRGGEMPAVAVPGW